MAVRAPSSGTMSILSSCSLSFVPVSVASSRAGLLGRSRTALQTYHTNEVVGGHRHLRPHLVASQPDEAELPPSSHRFHPAEDLLHTFTPALAPAVAGVARRPAVNRAPPSLSRRVLGHVRRDPTPPTASHEALGVVRAVSRDGLAAASA